MELLSKVLGVEHIEIDMSNLIFPNDPEICRMEALKRNSEIVQCPKCGVQGNRPNMMRWHFDNCDEMTLKECLQCKKIIPRNVKPHSYKKKHYCNRKCYMESKKGKNPIEMTSEVRKKISESRKKYYANRPNTTQEK